MNAAVVVIMIFIAVFLSVLALFFGIQSVRESPAAGVKRRLQRMAAENDTISHEAFTSNLLREKTTSGKLFSRLPLIGTVSSLVTHSGVQITPMRFVLLFGIAALSGFVVVFALSKLLLAALLALFVCGGMPFAYLLYCKKQRRVRFDEQLPDALSMVARSLRAGHSLSGAIELISQEMPEPTGGLFKIAYEQQQLGMRMTDSLRSLLKKIESIDLHFFVTIVRINNETGGNLAEILDKLADTVRSRLQIRRQVKVYSAQGRMSGYVLTIMPVATFFGFNVLNPGYMSVFYTERLCQLILCAAVMAQIVGFLVIRKIIDIRI